MLQIRSTSLLMVVLLALHREALIADERFERPNKGFRGPRLTSLANRQKHDTVMDRLSETIRSTDAA